MSISEYHLQQGVYRIIEQKFRQQLSKEQLTRIKQSAKEQLQAMLKKSALTLQIYDKQARSQKVVSISRAPEHEQDRNR